MGQNTNQKDTFFFLGEKATTSKIPKEKGRGLAAGHQSIKAKYVQNRERFIKQSSCGYLCSIIMQKAAQ